MGEFTKMYQSIRWRNRRKRFLLKNPFCVECLKNGRFEYADIVDHIIPHKGDWDLFINYDNLQSLCRVCHGKKSVKERCRYGAI